MNLLRKRFSRLLVLERAGFYINPTSGRKKAALWKCQCDCGNIAITRTASLNDGTTKSCGCLQKEKAAQAGRNNIGNTPFLGRNHTEESKEKMSKFASERFKDPRERKRLSIEKLAEKNPAWAGGKSFEKYTTDWTEELREEIRKRDNYECQLCGYSQNGNSLDVHHIDYNKKNNTCKNLISLCRSCHQKTNFNRNYWYEKFTTLENNGLMANA